MLVMNKTVLREVLLIWMPNLSIRPFAFERCTVDAGGPDVDSHPRTDPGRTRPAPRRVTMLFRPVRSG